MRRVRTAVFVSGGGTNLQALLDGSAAGDIPECEIALAVCDRAGAYALERAEKAGVETALFTAADYSDAAKREEAILELLAQRRIEFIVLAGFLSILSKEFIERFAGPIINVHPSLIPSFCGKGFYGLRVHEAALAKGVKVSGATVHFVNEIPDAGRIIAQKAVEVLDGDTPETLQKRIMTEAEQQLLPKAVQMVCERINRGEEL